MIKGPTLLDWDRVNVWTLTLFTIIRSLDLARSVSFGDLASLRPTIEEAKAWIPTVATGLLLQPFGKTLLRFRRDPNVHFELIVAQIIQMLVQDLVVIFDAMMNDILVARGESAGTFPPVQSREASHAS
jgi:hypothetical protein